MPSVYWKLIKEDLQSEQPAGEPKLLLATKMQVQRSFDCYIKLLILFSFHYTKCSCIYCMSLTNLKVALLVMCNL
jgi:hypothetical protein